MKLTLIQEQVLEALAHAQTVEKDPAAPAAGVSVAAVQRALRLRRPKATSERYIGQILREIADGYRVDGHPLVERRRPGRGIRYYAPATGLEQAFRRQRERVGAAEDSRRWDELNPSMRDELAAAGWVRARDGLWRHAESADPLGLGTALAVVRASEMAVWPGGPSCGAQ